MTSPTLPHHASKAEVLWSRLAEVTHRAADLAGAFGALEPALRRLATELAPKPLPQRKHRTSPPKAPPTPEIEFSELDRKRARQALHRAGVPTSGRTP
jgi:hypothetical protein